MITFTYSFTPNTNINQTILDDFSEQQEIITINDISFEVNKNLIQVHIVPAFNEQVESGTHDELEQQLTDFLSNFNC